MLTKNPILSPSFNTVELLDISNDSIVSEFLNMKQKLNKNDDEELYYSLFDSNIISTKENYIPAAEVNSCKETTSDELELNKKIPSKDEIKQNFKCDVAITACHSNNSNVKLLNSENSENRNTKDLKYVCDYCGKQFLRHKGLFKNHIARHADTKPHKCSHCQKVFHIRGETFLLFYFLNNEAINICL